MCGQGMPDQPNSLLLYIDKGSDKSPWFIAFIQRQDKWLVMPDNCSCSTSKNKMLAGSEIARWGVGDGAAPPQCVKRQKHGVLLAESKRKTWKCKISCVVIRPLGFNCKTPNSCFSLFLRTLIQMLVIS